jgi:hypothetical protein
MAYLPGGRYTQVPPKLASLQTSHSPEWTMMLDTRSLKPVFARSAVPVRIVSFAPPYCGWSKRVISPASDALAAPKAAPAIHSA